MLHYASMGNSMWIGELLIAKGADINAVAIIYLNIIILLIIITNFKKKRKLNLKNKTPLHWATWKNSKDMFNLLISKGANVNLFDFHNLKSKKEIKFEKRNTTSIFSRESFK